MLPGLLGHSWSAILLAHLEKLDHTLVRKVLGLRKVDVEETVCGCDVSPADKILRLQSGDFHLQLFGCSRIGDDLQALKVISLVCRIAGRLSFVCEYDE